MPNLEIEIRAVNFTFVPNQENEIFKVPNCVCLSRIRSEFKLNFFLAWDKLWTWTSNRANPSHLKTIRK